jgi:flavodoxin
VAYFSRTGNTRVIAHQIRRARDAQVFEINPATPYPEDYQATVDQARRERDSGHAPPLAARVAGIDRYHTIFLGLPVWGGTAPPVIRSFLSVHDLSGMRVVPFITHGGFGRGRSLDVIRSMTPGATVLESLVLEADQERRTLRQVTDWLRSEG